MDEIESGDEFRNWMLDLQARVHLEEIEVAILVDDEFDGAGIRVTGGFGDAHGDLAHTPAHIFGDDRRRRFFEYLLMAALHGAFALAEVDAVAVLVGEDLHFHVPRILDVFLDIDFAVAERAFGLATRSFERGLEFLRRAHHAHALAATTRRSLQHDGIADFGSLDFCFGVLQSAQRAGNKWNVGLRHCLAGAGFRAHACPSHRRSGR